MNPAKKILLASAMAALALCSLESAARELRIKTVDSFTGDVITNVTVTVSLWGDETPSLRFTRTSDAQGLIRLQRKTLQHVSCAVDATGRNYCTQWIQAKAEEDDSDVTLSVPVALRAQPVKLKVGYLKQDFPADGDQLQYDFLVGDWLPPVGRGKHADVVFTRQPRKCIGMAQDSEGQMTQRRMKDAVEVDFPGADNGIQVVPIVPQCQLWTRTAPETGYLPKYESFWYEDENMKTVRSGDRRKAFCFRIRTEKDEQGSITSCHYGKVYGDITFDVNGDGPPYIKNVRVLYFLNEKPMSTNLELDMESVSREECHFMLRP